MRQWTIQDQLDWEILREAPEDIASVVAARRPDLVRIMEDAARSTTDGEALAGEGQVADGQPTGSAGESQERRAALVSEEGRQGAGDAGNPERTR